MEVFRTSLVQMSQKASHMFQKEICYNSQTKSYTSAPKNRSMTQVLKKPNYDRNLAKSSTATESRPKNQMVLKTNLEPKHHKINIWQSLKQILDFGSEI